MIEIKLRVIMAEKYITRKQLSDMTQIRFPTITALYNNTAKEFPLYALDRICRALGCTPADIVAYHEDDTQE